MKKIEAVNNKYIKDLIKLHHKKYRDEAKKFIVEGYHLVEEAKISKALCQVLISSESDYIEGVENILVTDQIIEKLSFTKSPQKIIGVCNFFEEKDIVGNKFLLLDDIQDPGNLGTLIRCSLGFNIDLVVISLSSVDIYNDKFLRSTQGAIFNVPIVKKDLLEIIKILKDMNVPVLGTSLSNGTPLKDVPKLDKFALILGNEGNGIRKDILNKTDQNIFVEMNNKLESLNVAVAGGIILYNMLEK